MASRLEELANPPMQATDEEKQRWVEAVVKELDQRVTPTHDGWQALYDELSLMRAILLRLGEIISVDIFNEGDRIQTGLCIGRWCFVDLVTGVAATDGLWTYKRTAGSGRTQWNKLS